MCTCIIVGCVHLQRNYLHIDHSAKEPQPVKLKINPFLQVRMFYGQVLLYIQLENLT